MFVVPVSDVNLPAGGAFSTSRGPEAIAGSVFLPGLSPADPSLVDARKILCLVCMIGYALPTVRQQVKGRAGNVPQRIRWLF